jgi:hypothetical protein
MSKETGFPPLHRADLRALMRSEASLHVQREDQGMALDADRLLKLSWAAAELASQVDRAVSLGPVELMNLAEFQFQDNPNALRTIRRSYTDFCLSLFANLEGGRRTNA